MLKINSIRLRLALLIGATVIPAFLFICFGIYSQYRQARENALTDLNQFSLAFSTEQSQTIEGARQLLVALSDSSEINSLNPQTCSNYLSKLLNSYVRYANFGVADKSGNVICSGVATTQKINVSNRQFFKSATETKKFAVGEYQVGSITKKSVLNFGYPIFDSKDNVKAVVFSSLDLSWVSQYVAESSISEDTVLLLLDGNGVVLARSPEPELWIGKSFSKDPLVETVLDRGGGTTDILGLDNVKRLYSFNRIGGTDSKNPVYVVVGKTQNSVYKDADTNLSRSLAVLILIFTLVVLVSFRVGQIFIVKRIEDLEELDKLKSEFVSIASHQLRTPLSAINWFIELLKEDSKKLSKNQKEIIKNVAESNQRMINLVESLLNISRIEANKLKIEMQQFDIVKAVKQVMAEVKPRFKSKKQKLILELGKNPIVINADPKLVFQVISNIVTNANKYTPDKGTIKISIVNKKDQVIVKVSDNGYGIPKASQAKIFQKFYRADNISLHDIEGSGLGLYIAKSITQKMGGKMWFTSKVNIGSTFYVSFPRLM